MRIFTPLIATVLLAGGCNAGEGDIKTNIEKSFPGVKVDSVSKSPVAGLFEVVVGKEVVYTDEQGAYLLTGEMLETATKRNLTREKVEQLSAIDFSTLPLDQAVKVVNGDGKRVMAVFSDPDCPYCRKLEHELVKVKNVTIYNFMFPLPMHADAPRKARLVWCSADRAKSWTELMLNGTVPAGKDDCANPIAANQELAQKIGVDSTPAMILSNGRIVAGLAPADRIEAMLDSIGK
jgi:thiol:disulfide interchange protein DsbC